MKILKLLIIFYTFSSNLIAASDQSCFTELWTNEHSPTAFLSFEEESLLREGCKLPAQKTPNSIVVVQNLAVSITSFYLINTLQFYRELNAGKIDGKTLLSISCFEVLKNLVNYVWIENSGRFDLSAISLLGLNTFRMSLEMPIQNLSKWRLLIESSLAELFKNRVNFVVTENWFPVDWSTPPNLPSFFPFLESQKEPHSSETTQSE